MIAGAILIGVLAGVFAGMFGVGGGALFVPALVLVLGLSHLDAEATSLLAIVPVSAVGAWRQHRYGNFRAPEAGVVGATAIAGGVLGVVIANAVPERALQIGFAAVILFVAFRLARRALVG